MPPEIHIITANHLERLADAIAELVKTPSPQHPRDPIHPEVVLVQSKGMQQWVSMAIAERNGISANIAFPFPNAFLEQLYERTVGQPSHQQMFDSNVLTFRIMALLPQLLNRDEFKPIKQYLIDSSTSRKQFQLSSKIADVMDQYQIFRPEMVLHWESNQYENEHTTNAWQPILWRALNHGTESLNRAAVQNRLINQLTRHIKPLKNLPPRVSVFGISHLPPFHLKVLEALAHRIPVYLFLLNPCRHYWGDILSDKQSSRAKYRTNNPDLDPNQDLHIERGNRLLASWGEQGKQFFNLIHQMDGQLLDLFSDNTPQSLLAKIQQDILDLNDRPDNVSGPPANEHEDQSIQIHACHSPMREIEVLYDQLLEKLENDPTLNPRDILVMVPDIATYAPYIHAVFKNSHSGQPAIPYTVADQGMPRESRLIEGFLHLLELHQSRFQVSQVIALLAFPHIRRCFNLKENELPKIERWLHSAHIRWGWNGAHRKSHTLPRFEANTWRHGLDRLVLGYAMTGDGSNMFNDILPLNGVDAGDGPLLGALSVFVEKLYHQIGDMPERATIFHWHGVLIGFLENFFKIDETCAHEMHALRGIVDELADTAKVAGFTKEVPFEVVFDYLKRTLDQKTFGTGFMSGGTTFCAMLPMRSIPAKVVCILGLGHDAFPQDIREPVFNLISAEPALGDRSKRDDDKYLFLEALISARQSLYLSYVGRSIQDNTPIPPSVVIDELLEYLEAGFGIKPSRIATVHPLQAFSRRYFNNSDPTLFSYSKENLEASQAMAAKHRLPSFFTTALDTPKPSWRDCTLDQLVTFFTNPARFLLEQRLGIYLRQDMFVPEDREPFNLDALSRFKINQELLNAYIEGRDATQSYRAVCATGEMPHGTAGQVLLQQMGEEVFRFVSQLNRHLPKEDKETRPFELKVGPYCLSGELNGIYTDKRVTFRMAKVRPQDLISLFIAHLVMAAVTSSKKGALTSVLVCQDAQWQLGPVSDPHGILREYLDFFWDGLQLPAPFFPKTSYQYALKHHQGRARQQAIAASRIKWEGSPPYAAGEIQDPYFNLCFSHKDPLDDAFEKSALKVFLPLLSTATKL